MRPSPPTVPGVTVAPETTLPPETTVPPADRPAVAIGESVMLGAAPQLQAGGFVVNASESRQGEATASVVGQLRAAGQIGKIVVIQVGTNGPVAPETYDLIMSFLPGRGGRAGDLPHRRRAAGLDRAATTRSSGVCRAGTRT